MKDEWRCVIMESGRLFVIMTGPEKRHKLFVDSLDTKEIL